MNYSDIILVFRDIAEKNKKINSIDNSKFVPDLERLQESNVRIDFSTPVLCLMAEDLALDNYLNRSIKEVWRIKFLVIQNCDYQDEQNIIQTQTDCQVICREIVSWFLTAKQTGKKEFLTFKPDNVQMQPISSGSFLPNNAVGFMVNITIPIQTNFNYYPEEYNPDVWNY